MDPMINLHHQVKPPAIPDRRLVAEEAQQPSVPYPSRFLQGFTGGNKETGPSILTAE